jgi:hypothetical protein
MGRKKLNVLIILSILALGYCLLGVLQTGMLAGAPNYSPIRAQYNEHLWTSLSGVFLGLVVFFLWLRARERRQEREPSQPDQPGKTCP